MIENSCNSWEVQCCKLISYDILCYLLFIRTFLNLFLRVDNLDVLMCDRPPLAFLRDLTFLKISYRTKFLLSVVSVFFVLMMSSWKKIGQGVDKFELEWVKFIFNEYDDNLRYTHAISYFLFFVYFTFFYNLWK